MEVNIKIKRVKGNKKGLIRIPLQNKEDIGRKTPK